MRGYVPFGITHKEDTESRKQEFIGRLIAKLIDIFFSFLSREELLMDEIKNESLILLDLYDKERKRNEKANDVRISLNQLFIYHYLLYYYNIPIVII